MPSALYGDAQLASSASSETAVIAATVAATAGDERRIVDGRC